MIDLSPLLLKIAFISEPNFATTTASLNNWNALRSLGNLTKRRNLDDSNP